MKEQQKRKIQQFHPEIEDGIDLRRCPQEPFFLHFVTSPYKGDSPCIKRQFRIDLEEKK